MPQTINEYARKLRYTYASASPEELTEGAKWYPSAHEELRSISHDTGFSLRRITWAAAALSSNKTWKENVRLTRHVASQLRFGERPTGHFPDVLAKAKRILEDGEYNALSGPKVVPFAHALWSPESESPVVDRWMMRAVGEKLSPLRQGKVAEALTKVAREVRKPVPAVQATIWLTTQREGGNEHRY